MSDGDARLQPGTLDYHGPLDLVGVRRAAHGHGPAGTRPGVRQRAGREGDDDRLAVQLGGALEGEARERDRRGGVGGEREQQQGGGVHGGH